MRAISRIGNHFILCFAVPAVCSVAVNVFLSHVLPVYFYIILYYTSAALHCFSLLFPRLILIFIFMDFHVFLCLRHSYTVDCSTPCSPPFFLSFSYLFFFILLSFLYFSFFSLIFFFFLNFFSPNICFR